MGEVYQRGRIGNMLAALFALLALATSASAECAWALWVNPAGTPTGWNLARGVPAWYGSKADCENTAAYRDGGKPSPPGDVMCLPQGVQPFGKAGSYEYGPWRGGR